jgi:hypothetical protein
MTGQQLGSGIFALIGIVLMYVAAAGTADGKGFKFPFLDITVPAPTTPVTKALLFVPGLTLTVVGLFLIVLPALPSLVTPTPTPTAVISTATYTPAPSSTIMPISPTSNPSITLASTTTPSASATLTSIPPTPVPSIPPILISTYFPPGCIPASSWTYYPPDPNTAGQSCLHLGDFLPEDTGLSMSRVTVANSGEQQRGLYTAIQGDAEISFTVKIDNFVTRSGQSGASTFSPNIALGVTDDTGSHFTYNGVFLYFYATSPSDFSKRLQVQVVRADGVVAYNAALDTGKSKSIKFTIQRNTLRVFVGDMERSVATISLGFSEKAFYLGYRLPEITELSASVTSFSLCLAASGHC